MELNLEQKYKKLKEDLKSMGRVAVAFSAGVDSTLLLAAAVGVLGTRAVAVSAEADWIPHREQSEAEDFCKNHGIQRIRLKVQEEDIAGFSDNPPKRCYLCKKVLFTKIIEAARGQGISHVIEGSNMDDLSDYRPGLKAIEELGVKSPLREAGLSKTEIRELSRLLGLPTADKPSFACLASRIPYGEKITAGKLFMAEQGEQLLLDEGFLQFRVRVHGTLARIELLPEEMERIMQEPLREKIYGRLREIGFFYVTLDLKGYRTGSLNEAIGEIAGTKEKERALVLEKGRPASSDTRLEKERRVYDLLDELGVEYERIDHDAVMTMERCRDIDAALGAEICKNLFLCNRQKTQFYLLMIAGDKTFHTKELSAQIKCARLSFADASYMEEFLDITPGSVSVMGLMNDTGNRVRLLVDEDLLKSEFIGCHPCVNTSSLKLRTRDVFGPYLKAVHHDMTTVRL